MKAMIFAAGLGTRLKPFTLEHPKALVPVAGVPMLERVILRLRQYGITEIVINVHHFAQQIIDFLIANDNFGLNISISDESGLLLDTGGGLLAARYWLVSGSEQIVVCNADILTDFDLSAMIEAHQTHDAMATLLVANRETSRKLLLDDNMRMHGWCNCSTGEVKPPCLDPTVLSGWAFGGWHVVSPAIFKYLLEYNQAIAGRDAISPFSIISFYIEMCKKHEIIGFAPASPYMWHDVGKPSSLAQATHDLLP